MSRYLRTDTYEQIFRPDGPPPFSPAPNNNFGYSLDTSGRVIIVEAFGDRLDVNGMNEMEIAGLAFLVDLSGYDVLYENIITR